MGDRALILMKEIDEIKGVMPQIDCVKGVQPCRWLEKVINGDLVKETGYLHKSVQRVHNET